MINDAEQKIQKSRKEAQKQLVDIQTWAEMVRMDMKEAELRLSDVRIKIDMAAKDRRQKASYRAFRHGRRAVRGAGRKKAASCKRRRGSDPDPR